MLRLGLSLLCLFSVFASAHAADYVEGPHTQLKLLSETASAQPGQSLQAGLYFKLEPEWHVYWTNAGDSGQPPKIQWKLPSGFSAGDIQWPYPERLPAGPLVSFGYKGEVLLPVAIEVPRGVSDGQVAHLAADVRWLVCKDICIPGRAKVALDLPVRASTAEKSADAALFSKFQAMLPTALPSAWSAHAISRGDALELEIEGAKLSAADHPFFYPLSPDVIDNATEQKLSEGPNGSRLTIKKSDQLTTLPSALNGVLVVGQKAYPVDAAFPGAAPISAASLLQAMILAMLGGLILNLMPCVFPVLSIKALSLLGMAHESRSRVRLHGWAYTLGVLVSFWIFAGAIFLLRSGGQALGWGFQLQSPGFVAILAELLFLVSLNLLGVFEVSFAGAGAGGHLAGMSGLGGSFFTGVLATVVATPCTAPFMGTALGIAMTQPVIVGLAIFTSLGFGLALPYLLLSFAPSLGKILPRPGRWMESFRQFLAFPLLGTVIWLVWVFSLQSGSTALLLSSLLMIGLGAWAVGRWRGKVAWTAFWTAMILAVALGAHAGQSQSVTASEIHWEPYSAVALQTALGTGKPVFVDLTAAWCLTCKVNERVALDNAGVVEKMRALGVTALRGDWTNSNPEITELLGEFGRSGVPLYLLYSGQPNQSPEVLPQILTPNMILSRLNLLRGTSQ